MIASAFIVVAVVTASLTILGEAARAVLLLTLHVYALWTLFAVHRGRFEAYDFGVGKIESLIWVALGSGFLLGAYWVTDTVFAVLSSGVEAASPRGLALAAIVNALGLLINFVGWRAMHTAAREDSSGVLKAQIEARFAMFLASLILQVTLTAAALVKDPVVATWFDAAGALILVYFKLIRGLFMLRRGLQELLDAPEVEAVRAQIHRAASAVLPEGGVVALKTRRSGRRSFMEISVFDTTFDSTADLARSQAAVQARVAETVPHVEVRIVPVRNRAESH